MLILAAYVATVLVGYRIVLPLAGRGAALATVASLLLFSVWAFPAWTFAFYSPVAILLALAGLERLLAWQRTGHARDLLFVGLLFGLSICFKQNYGVFGLVGATIGFVAFKLEGRQPLKAALTGSLREVLITTAGVVLAGLPFLVYLIYNGALPDAWQSLVVHPFEFGGRHDIPFAPLTDLGRADLYTSAVERLTYLSYAMLNAPPVAWVHGFRGLHRLHVLAYWLPPMTFLGGLWLALRVPRREDARFDASMLTLVSTGGMLFLGVLPRADFNHLVNVYQPVLVAAPVVIAGALRALGAEHRRARQLLIGTTSLIAFAYGATALFWYQALIDKLDTPIKYERAGVLVGGAEASAIDHQLRTIRENSAPGDAVLTLPDLSMLNFLAERDVPSAYYNLYEHHIAKDQGAAVVAGAELRDVQLVVTRYDNFFSDRVGLIDYAPQLSDYIISHFERLFVGANQDYIVYRRRAEPIAEHPFVNALGDCQSELGLAERSDHLLFSSLQHRSRPYEPIPPEGVETTCRLRIPEEGGFLSLEIGYRQPHAASRDAQLHVVLSIRDGERVESILDQRLRVVRARRMGRETPFKRFEIDLYRFAGHDVELIFETYLEGEVQSHPLDFKGFAMVWRDVRLQSERGGARP
jgi:hypothetical protein